LQQELSAAVGNHTLTAKFRNLLQTLTQLAA
jgi:hypothetical protein